ncbi:MULTISPECIES: MSCRAMM family protein [Prauserella salsuginis group]|uniref:Collagen binding domain-containing protein n=1 Tax=Prauserella salsuginis TaxID=387889 RepID=A0ABW6G8X7_9PSEU|nr:MULTISPECIES: Ig-like domain-containing protein [Prauserella salsuginis group]
MLRRGFTRRAAVAVRLLVAVALASFSLVVVAPAASAEVKEGNGHTTTPGQPYGGQDRESDWLGSYVVGGKQVFCVQFALKAPDSGEQYRPGDELLTKWGEKIPEDTAANISYLLLRYGDTQNADEAAALAHLLHSWTAAPRTPADLDRNLPFDRIAYNVDGQFAKLPQGAKDAVERLRADANANRGPWTAEVTAPEQEQTIGEAGEWSVSVTNAAGKGVPGVPVTLSAEGAQVGGERADVTTGEDGTATFPVTPQAEEPSVTATMSAPAARPYVQDPVTANTQRVVSTGGEQELTASATGTAKNAPGGVEVTKVDAESDKGIAGVPLRITAGDKESAAKGDDGKPLVGEDGKPAVVTTEGDGGAATVDELSAPQRICVIEVSPPNGYADAFDPDNPPSACGKVQPGGTLELTISNKADQVPTVIPAGEQGQPTAQSPTTTSTPTGALVGMGGLALAVAVASGLLVRRRQLSGD